MEVFWITFRLESNETYNERYKELIAAVKEHVDVQWWFEPTSFWLIASNSSRESIAASVYAAIDTATDLALIGSMDHKGAALVGKAAKLATLKKLIPTLEEW